LNSDLQTLNDQELELAQLDREVRLLEGKYAMHVEKLEQARVNDALSRERITNVKIAQPASLTHKPVAPKKPLLLAGTLMLALIGGIGSAFAAEAFDQTLRTTPQVEEKLALPVLASIPYRKRRRKHRAAVGHDGAEWHGSYRGLVSTLRSGGSNVSTNSKTVAVVGCEASKQRSRVAGNLAVEAARSGSEPVLLVDADARHRRISKRFHLNGAPGWRDIVAGNSAVTNYVQQSRPSNLAVMGPGGVNGVVGNSDTSTSARAAAQLDDIKSKFGFVVVDLPATGDMEGLPTATEWIDEAVLVVEAERTRIQAAQRVKDLLHRAGVRVAGVVLTNRRDYIPRWLYKRL
jgi:Mrp family chromosome partitioning ATPase